MGFLRKLRDGAGKRWIVEQARVKANQRFTSVYFDPGIPCRDDGT
jgi:hypothetical protein